ncbi:hypothetical protein KLP28_06320 [Nocardioidaceae bacterium]|nr:hypothetical protein KLP28_06320 [Nocardioidaceae bacterium]
MSEPTNTESTHDVNDTEQFSGAYSVDAEDQLQPEDTLVQGGAEDVLEEGIVPSESYSPGQGFGTTPEEARQGETIDQRERQRVPEPDPYAEPARDEDGGPADRASQLGDEPAGQINADNDEISAAGRMDDRFATERDPARGGDDVPAEQDAVRVIPEPGDEHDHQKPRGSA